MKKAFTIVFLFLFHISFSQNLVNNWSFEDTVACPDNITQIDRAVGWMSFKFTPDYFNACAPSTNIVPVSAPHNIWGDQLAHTGNAYAGFIAYKTGAANAREFIATQLNQPLVSGQKYFLSFWVSSAFGYMNSQDYPHLACNNLGAKFTKVAYSSANPMSVNNFAHIVDTNIINDTINWIKISGSFIADSIYSYLVIGNFFDDSNTSWMSIGTALPNDAYYYLDDVKLSTDSLFVDGVSEINNSNQIKIFPNPARDWIVLEGKGIKSVEITNALGSAIGSYPTSAFTLRHTINLSSLSSGIYFLKINMIDERFQIKKIIIQ
jgi:hypothetical protein